MTHVEGIGSRPYHHVDVGEPQSEDVSNPDLAVKSYKRGTLMNLTLIGALLFAEAQSLINSRSSTSGSDLKAPLLQIVDPPAVLSTGTPEASKEDWFDVLKKALGSAYEQEGNILYYKSPDSASEKPRSFVMMREDKMGTFNEGPDGVAGRESVRWVEADNFYIIDGRLVAVDTGNHIDTFDTRSGFWQPMLGQYRVAHYIESSDGKSTRVTIWKNDIEQDSGYSIDKATGKLVPTSR